MGSTHQSIIIDAPIEDVWARISDFHDLSWAPNVVTSVDPSGSGMAVGAQRILNGVFSETLLSISKADHEFTYSIDDGPSPVSADEVANYRGKVRLEPTREGGTLVEWSSSWDADSDDAVDFCHGIYVALLDDMKKSVE